MRKNIIIALFILVSLFLFGCAKPAVQEDAQYLGITPEKGTQEEPKKLSAVVLDTELTDVRTGVTFKISDFSGKPVLLESFAVWCPVCTQQQKNIQKLHQELGDAFVSISLDTDPNEDAALVKEAVEERGFAWYFAVSPKDATQALIDQFGVSVVDAPAAPIILICEDQSARLLKRGQKSVQDLKAEMAKGC